MKHSLPLVPQFYVTAPQPCPYLEDKIERKLFTGLNNDNGEALNNTLSSKALDDLKMYYIALHALAVQHVYQQEYGSKILN